MSHSQSQLFCLHLLLISPPTPVFTLGLCCACLPWHGHQPPAHQQMLITQAGVMLLPFPPPQVLHKFLYYFSNAAENRFFFPLAVTTFKSHALTNSYSSAKKKKKGSPLVQSPWKIEGTPTRIQRTGKWINNLAFLMGHTVKAFCVQPRIHLKPNLIYKN